MRRLTQTIGLIAALTLAATACKGDDKSSSKAKPNPGKTDQQTKPDPTKAAPPKPSAPANPLAAAVAHDSRPAEDRARDADRKPAEIMAFFEIGPGTKVADLMAGTGYYTELLARAVGVDGAVHAQNNEWLVKRFGDDKMKARLDNPDLANVDYQVMELDALTYPPGELDAALMVLFYHDTYWLKTDRAKMNKQIFDALKPGGVYGIVDHYAEDGSGERDVQTLHRGDAEMIKKEILDAGFVLDAETDALRHPEDDRKKIVFDKDLRGKTDRFVYRFRKPKS